VSVQESVQEARVLDRDSIELDITFDTAVNYLDVLRAKTLERIQRENLSLTRANLETAALRVEVGTASAGEVFRWENKIALDRRRVIEAQRVRGLAEIRVNRLLNRPLDEAFVTQEAAVADPSIVPGQERVSEYLDVPSEFRILADFMAQEGFTRSPELQAIGALARAQQRVLTSADRSFWLPDFAATADLTGFFARGGAGSDLPPLLDFAEVDDINWFVGFNATYPLFDGKARYAARDQARIELQRLEFERRAVSQRIDEAVRSALQRAQASYVGIELAGDALIAASRNYDLVRAEYERGTATIIRLLDAQNTALIAQESEARAVYEFLIDLMAVQRAVGSFSVFGTPADIDAFFDRLDQYRQAAEQSTVRQ